MPSKAPSAIITALVDGTINWQGVCFRELTWRCLMLLLLEFGLSLSKTSNENPSDNQTLKFWKPIAKITGSHEVFNISIIINIVGSTGANNNTSTNTSLERDVRLAVNKCLHMVKNNHQESSMFKSLR